MKLNDVLDALFPSGHAVTVEGNLAYGPAPCGSRTVAVIGVVNGAAVGLEEILAFGDKLLAIMRDMPKAPILMLVDNAGQRMALREELLALPQYIANLIKLQDLARRKGHALLTLVYGAASAGGFIACGMCADRVYALADAQTSVMNLKSIARVTHMELAKLEELAKTVPVFAPGVNNLEKMGGLEAIWTGDLPARLAEALDATPSGDGRAALGKTRGGRTMARDVMERVETAVLD